MDWLPILKDFGFPVFVALAALWGGYKIITKNNANSYALIEKLINANKEERDAFSLIHKSEREAREKGSEEERKKWIEQYEGMNKNIQTALNYQREEHSAIMKEHSHIMAAQKQMLDMLIRFETERMKNR